MAKRLPAGITHRLVDMANANDATMRPVMELIAANDVVVGMSRDSTQPDGVGLLIVKGANRLREIVATVASGECSITAIKRAAYEHAEALRQHIGVDRRRVGREAAHGLRRVDQLPGRDGIILATDDAAQIVSQAQDALASTAMHGGRLPPAMVVVIPFAAPVTQAAAV